MFDLQKGLPFEVLTLAQRFFSTTIGLALVIVPLSSSIANELQYSTVVEPGTSKMELFSHESLRILYHGTNNVAQAIAQKERALVEQFAKENQLTTEWYGVEDEWQLMSALISGHGDIVIGQGESLAAGMPDQIKFTYSWGVTRQQLVVRTDTTQIERLDDLFVRQIALKKSSPSWPILEKYLPENSAMDLVAIPESIERDEIMMRVASGEYDVAVVESGYLDEYLPQHPELSVAFDFSKAESHAWAVRTDAEILQNRLNEFLNKTHLSMIVTDVRLEDLPRMQERKVLRVITYQSPGNYFFNNGKMHGFEYSFIKEFAKSKRMNVDVVLASSHEEMRELLLSGDGDIIAASLPENSLHDENIKMTIAYDYSAPVIIGRDTEKSLVDIRDLEGRRIALAPESPYRGILEGIQRRGIDFEIIGTDEGVNVEETLYRVSHAMSDLTILGGHQVKAELTRQYGLKPLFTLSEPVGQSWAVRASDHKLLAAVNDYIEQEYRGDTYNVLYGRYLSRPKNRKAESRLLTHVDKLSPYDEIVKKSAKRHSFDWRLIVAQMYQESQFDPAAVSYAGAEGLMQLMPATARDLGVEDVNDPTLNITAGVKYMSILRDQFEQGLPLEDKTWFTLASYNAGFTRVKKARLLAEKMGLDSDRWFGNVEKAMLKLSKPYTQDGEVKRLCRCGQAVVYVQDIRSLYNNYVRLTEITQLARADIDLKARDI
ncbi:MAG: transporter substrate-binding domain-containing protein [Proteobacteria bacterium]|nr:transporter substrate-binding domain-containing protein [Pseudomonadota bacterium]